MGEDGEGYGLDDYGFNDPAIDPGVLGGAPTTMPSNSWWQDAARTATNVIAARVSQSAGVNPAPTNRPGQNRQASTTPGFSTGAAQFVQGKPGLLVVVLVVAAALVFLKRAR